MSENLKEEPRTESLSQSSTSLSLSFSTVCSDMPECNGGDDLRLVCMGKGYLMPDSRTLEDCQIPVFKTHPTPINVSVKPDGKHAGSVEKDVKKKKAAAASVAGGRTGSSATGAVEQGCGCVIL
jgi:hypothetical protein